MSIEISFVSQVTDLAEFEALLLEYYTDVLQIARTAGLPELAPEDMAHSSMEHLADMLPPHGRLALARSQDGELVGCGTLRRIRPNAVEMKRMYVSPAARGNGLGQILFQMRMDEARKMGCRFVYADTAKGNRPMLSMYERGGFHYIERYPENANPVEFEPYLVYLQYDLEPENPDNVAP